MLSYLRRKRSIKEWFYFFLHGLHLLTVLGFLWAGIVEFIDNPPFFDAYGDADTRNSLPGGLFENDPRTLDKSQSLRLMDLPILCILIAYAAVCCWLKFRGLSWLLTACFTLTILCFYIVNYWAYEFFDWRYFPRRNLGLDVQVLSIALSTTCIFMVLFYERKKMPIKFKSSLPVRPFGKIHIAANFLAIYLVTFTCLILWFSKLYVSWACFKNHDDVMGLCERTTMVQCYPCDSCNTAGLKKCVKDKHKMYHCLSYIEDVSTKKGSFCIFNYNISVYTFLTVFAYVGGLIVFLSTFYRIVMHYVLRLLFLIVNWINNRHGRQPEELYSNPSNSLQVHEGALSPYDYMHETDDSLSLQIPDRELPSEGDGDLVDAMT